LDYERISPARAWLVGISRIFSFLELLCFILFYSFLFYFVLFVLVWFGLAAIPFFTRWLDPKPTRMQCSDPRNIHEILETPNSQLPRGHGNFCSLVPMPAFLTRSRLDVEMRDSVHTELIKCAYETVTELCDEAWIANVNGAAGVLMPGEELPGLGEDEIEGDDESSKDK